MMMANPSAVRRLGLGGRPVWREPSVYVLSLKNMMILLYVNKQLIITKIHSTHGGVRRHRCHALFYEKIKNGIRRRKEDDDPPTMMMLLQQQQHFRYAFSQMNSYTKYDDDDVHEIHQHPSARAAKPTILIFD
jgi:hypothetical protein